MPQLDVRALDTIIQNTLQAIDESRGQIFSIAELARSEYQRLQAEIEEVRRVVESTIVESENTERFYRAARLRLMEVSRDFKRYTEEDIRAAYEAAQGYQVHLAELNERERSLRQRRDDLERNLRTVQQTVEKAEGLITKVGVVMEFMSGNLATLSSALDDLEQRRKLGAQVILAQEEERKRVARDIHDGPAQALANAVLRVEICDKYIDTNELNSVRTELGELKRALRDALRDLRQIIFALRPMSLDDLGLAPALRRYAGEFSNMTGVAVDLQVTGKERRLPTPSETALFRMVQEGLQNIAKHAGVDQARVRLEYGQERVYLLIADDGKGFDMQKVVEQGGNHFGLQGLNERVQVLGGEVKIDSRIGQGTRIRISLPMEEGGQA